MADSHFHIAIGEGWFGAPYVRTLLDAESPARIKDIEGPESDALIDYAGWTFIEEPLHVALLDGEAHAVAIAWIAATTRGLNLTYIVAESEAGKGLAGLAVAQGIIAYAERRVDVSSASKLTVHAQYEKENLASARVAASLGLLPNKDLTFSAGGGDGARRFIGSEAGWVTVLARAQSIAGCKK